jgi:hypothetical protein
MRLRRRDPWARKRDVDSSLTAMGTDVVWFENMDRGGFCVVGAPIPAGRRNTSVGQSR